MAASLTILFWNVQKKDLSVNVARLVRLHGADLVVLAEIPNAGGAEAGRRLEAALGAPVVYANRRAISGKTHVYLATPIFNVEYHAVQVGERVNVFKVSAPEFPAFVLATVHLIDKRNSTVEGREEEARLAVSAIRSECQGLGLPPHLICGDFNVDPYDPPLRKAVCFHAVMDRRTALRGARTIGGRVYPMLYNPMWSLLGDLPKGPPGTFYRGQADHETTYWHLPDAFLLSPEMLRLADVAEVAILADDGEEAFLASGRIQPRVYSDHLPILLRLEKNP